MKTHHLQLDMELESDKDNILNTGLINYAQDAIEGNERDVLTDHISSRLEADTARDGITNLSDDETQSAKTYKVHKIEILSNHLKNNSKLKANQEQFDLSHVPVSSFHAKSVVPSFFCVDIGASRSCIGLSQYRRILHSINRRNMPVHASNRTFRIEDRIVKSLGMVELALETPNYIQLIPVLLDIVPVYVPALLCLDILDVHSLLAENVSSRLWHRVLSSEVPLEVEDVRSIPLKRIDTRVYARMNIPAHTFYTSRQFE